MPFKQAVNEDAQGSSFNELLYIVPPVLLLCHPICTLAIKYCGKLKGLYSNVILLMEKKMFMLNIAFLFFFLKKKNLQLKAVQVGLLIMVC